MLPAIYHAIVVFRYFLILLGGSFGLFGMVTGLMCILAHVCSLRSFGTPFMVPFAPVF
ncbi:spore germination protein [Sporolactobacillus sp. CQH2019]|uniref:spore germination protein n=1 Tax=Sporolactobacillus sp. CQH2019 TaxID=3023512 RepID=UPI003FD307C9